MFMESGNHTLLQVVANAVKSLDAEGELTSEDNHAALQNLAEIGQSIDAIYPHSTGGASENQLRSSRSSGRQPQTSQVSLRKQLAEAAEKEVLSESDDDAAGKADDESMDKDVFREMSIDEKLKAIFELPAVEELKGEWPCYLVRSVLLPGRMYLTQFHICFYASLPRRQDVPQKSGFLFKKARTTKIYTRYYFELKNDVLSWCETSTDTYYPLGVIDLRYVLEVRPSKRREHGIKIRTVERLYYLQADTKQSMVEWINTLQKAIFRAKQNGDSVKIVLRCDNILDIEKTAAFEFADYLRIRTVDNDDSYAMDEYYFAYFPDTDQTYREIKQMWQGNQPKIPPPIITSTLGKSKPDDTLTSSPSTILSPLPHNHSHATSGTSSRFATTAVGAAVGAAMSVPSALKDLFYPASSIRRPQSHAVTDGTVEESVPSPTTASTPTTMSSSTASTPTTALTPMTSSSVPAPNQSKHQKRSSLSYLPFLQTSQSTPPIQHRYPPPPASPEDDGNSSPEEAEGEKAMITWLNEKRRNGMRMMYDLIASPTVGQSGEQGARTDEVDREQQRQAHLREEGFKRHFVLPESEKLVVVFQTHLLRTLPYYGKLYISSNYLCFRSKVVGTKLKFIIPLNDIIRIQKQRSLGYIFHELSVVTKQEEVYLEFHSMDARNSCFAILFLHTRKHGPLAHLGEENRNNESKNLEALFMEEEDPLHDIEHVPVPRDGLPLLSSSSPVSETYAPPDKPLHITCLTIGTRGDVQPYIALCKSLMMDGHKCRIATHTEYREWIEGHGIEFSSIGGDPAELMRLCVDNGFLSVGFVREGFRLFKGWFDDLLETAWIACQGTDVLIESPSAMVGIHLAEKLGIAYFRAFPMPWTRTRSFPHPFATPDSPKGRLYNDMTYVMIDHVLWKATAYQVNRFRRQRLGLPATNWEKLEVYKVPFLYCFSASIVPPPLDWMDWIHTTGYWFLDNPDPGWQPPQSLLNFLEADDVRPIVYIGFGSIIVQDPEEVTRIIVEAVLKASVRAIISKGWSTRAKVQPGEEDKHLSGKEQILNQKSETSLTEHPGVIYNVDSLPHDWLFPKVRGVVHHGGAGTTSAGLRAGVPTIVKPFFGDQYFWGDRLEEMGVGLCLKKFTVEKLAIALFKIATDESMLVRAKAVGEKIRSENGVASAIQCIYRDLDLARNRLKKGTEDRVPFRVRDGEDDHGWTFIDRHNRNSTGSGSGPGSASDPEPFDRTGRSRQNSDDCEIGSAILASEVRGESGKESG